MGLRFLLCGLLFCAATTPAVAAPQCETELARLEFAEKRVFAVERYGIGLHQERVDRRLIRHVTAWKGTENGAPRIITYTEVSGTDGGTWGSVADETELKAKIAWRNLDGEPLADEDKEDKLRIASGPLAGEWTVACEGRPPIKVNFPRFADYPAAQRPYRGRVKRPLVSRKIDETVRLRVADAFSPDDKPNFASRYVRLTWPCGTACVGGALLDATNGRMIWLPYMSSWGIVGDDFEPFDGRLDSRLLVLSGMRNENGIIGRHFYVMEKNGKLRHLRSVEVERIFPQKLE